MTFGPLSKVIRTAYLIVSPRVGFANNPFSASLTHTSQASNSSEMKKARSWFICTWTMSALMRGKDLICPSGKFLRPTFVLPSLHLVLVARLVSVPEMTMAFISPRPRTVLTTSFGNLESSSRKIHPNCANKQNSFLSFKKTVYIKNTSKELKLQPQ